MYFNSDYIEPDLVPCKDGTLVAIHSVDLNVTTNVHTYNNGQFKSRARQSTANKNEWGYYVHDFNWTEVQQLSVRQRVSETGSRTNVYDYMFKVPSFNQIVNLLHDWNTRELPLIGQPTKVGGVPGIFAELKRSQFFMEDANISIADLFIEELAQHPKASDLLFDHLTLCDGLKHDEYRVPPLVVHSFEADVLEYLRTTFKTRWMDFVKEDALLQSGVVNDPDEEDDEIDHPWIPPMVFLVHHDYCQSTEFWFEVAKLHISGIGVDKKCLLPSEEDMESSNHHGIQHAKREAREWVAKAHSERLGVYPWTVRLEIESQSEDHVGGVPKIFSSAKEELKYYYCDLNVDGAWAEDVTTARIVVAEGCDNNDDSSTAEESNPPQLGGSSNDLLCVDKERNLWLLGLAMLAIGTFLRSILTCFVSAALTKRGYFGGSRGGAHTPVSQLQLPEIDLHMEEDDDDENEII